ncbi:glycerol-3-phosphate dehydrogenase 2 [Amycolatopsis decaplanina DSM 44594]|uniref:Glycerol-3-phosphate dehydrogenase 2 n=2 Tax=Amycolatopsis decaplanina TaxID=208441 RepID=M2ZBB2_9PSEU|nr:glycerol-3-phosphate dehydrogenase 2 [Amycolatopsis decaplanina DSM 44594]
MGCGPRDGECLVRDADHLAEVGPRLRHAGVDYRLGALASPNTSVVFGTVERPYVLRTADSTIDSSLLLERLAFDAVSAGARVLGSPGQPALERRGEAWSLRQGDVEVVADRVVLALGAGLPDYLGTWVPQYSGPVYVPTVTRVVVLSELPLSAPVIPLFDAAPTVVPVWHQRQWRGATVCVPFDNVPGRRPDRVGFAEAEAIVKLAVEQLPGVGEYLSRHDDTPVGVYTCEKLIVSGQRDGTEESRSFRVDQYPDGLYAFYAGKFTTASVGARACLRELGVRPKPGKGKSNRVGYSDGKVEMAQRAAVAPPGFELRIVPNGLSLVPASALPASPVRKGEIAHDR